mgnify:CR=1 FL=1
MSVNNLCQYVAVVLRRPPIARRGSFATLGVALLAVLLLASPLGAQDLDDLKEERRRVQAERAATAAQVDAGKANVSELSEALDVLQANVASQQDALAVASQALADAEAEVAAADARLTEIEAERDSTIVAMQGLMVEAYVGGDTSGRSLLSFDDLETVETEMAYVDARFGNLDDLRDTLRAIEEDAADTLAVREDAEAEAAVQRETEARVLGELDEAKNAQAALVEDAEIRLNARLAEAAVLADADSDLSRQISEQEAEIARRLAAERERQRRAQQQAAARASSSSSSSGSSSSSSSGSSGASGGGSTGVVGSGSIVSAGGIQVHRSIAGNVSALLSAAAADGVPLAGWGYRSSDRQVQLRRQNCGSSNYAIYQAPSSSCSPPTARPGSSNHERGLAIDFTYGGGTIGSRSSPGYRWLASNAARFGLYNLPSEPWHWSTNGN